MSWQQAWNQAQPHLDSIRHSLLNFPHVSPRILRVGQLDAELLDKELLQVLTDPLLKALGLASYRSRFEPELILLTHLILYKFSVWDFGATYGAKLQNLRYKASSPATPRVLAPCGLPRRTLCLHAMLNIALPYLHTRIRVYALSRAWPDAPTSDSKRKAWNLLMRLESVHNILSVASFITFLCDGRYRTWADRLLHLQLVPSQRSSTREVSYEFMNRQMVWHAFTEFLLFLLPLVNTRVLRRQISHALSQLSLPRDWTSNIQLAWGLRKVADKGTENLSIRRGKYWSLPEVQCAICVEDASFRMTESQADVYLTTSAPASSATATDEPSRHPIYTPYISSCGHIYCYLCLSERMLRAADDGERAWECLRCGSMVLSANRVEGTAIASEQASSDDLQLDEFSFQSEDFLSTSE